MAVLRDKSQFAQWVTFLESIQAWPEAQAVARIKCPKMVFFGANAEAVVPYVPTIRERSKELEAMGWHVTEIAERGHSVGVEPATLVPIVRKFLDKVS